MAYLFHAKGHDYGRHRFHHHMRIHGLEFEGEEYESRLGNFRKNLHTVSGLNKQSTNGVVYAANHLTHMSQEEIRDTLLGYRPSYLNEAEVYLSKETIL